MGLAPLSPLSSAPQSAALDLRSKEEKDAELDKRIEALRKKNEALIKRYQVWGEVWGSALHSPPPTDPPPIACAEAAKALTAPNPPSAAA